MISVSLPLESLQKGLHIMKRAMLNSVMYPGYMTSHTVCSRNKIQMQRKLLFLPELWTRSASKRRQMIKSVLNHCFLKQAMTKREIVVYLVALCCVVFNVAAVICTNFGIPVTNAVGLITLNTFIPGPWFCFLLYYIHDSLINPYEYLLELGKYPKQNPEKVMGIRNVSVRSIEILY